MIRNADFPQKPRRFRNAVPSAQAAHSSAIPPKRTRLPSCWVPRPQVRSRDRNTPAAAATLEGAHSVITTGPLAQIGLCPPNTRRRRNRMLTATIALTLVASAKSGILSDPSISQDAAPESIERAAHKHFPGEHRMLFLHRHHPHHPHHPHAPHTHAPHTHTPHSHAPHSHTPHSHTPHIHWPPNLSRTRN